MAALGAPRIIQGWKEIESYLRRSRRTIDKYRKREGLPIARLGRHVLLTPEGFTTWLIARERHQLERRAARIR